MLTLKPSAEISKFEAAYIAGILDADGMVGRIRRKRKAHLAPMISITKTDKRIIDWFQERFPGTLSYREPKGSQRKPFWVYRISDHAVVEKILSSALPYMVMKRDQAEIVLKLIRSREGKGMGDHYNEDELTLSMEFAMLAF